MNAQHHLSLCLRILIVLSILCQTSLGQAQTSSNSSTEDIRIARLAGLAKTWGTVKYFHPFLAYRDIDWDKALIETIPKVNTATTPQDYAAALNQMLAVLGDKNTQVEIGTAAKDPGNDQSQTSTVQPVRTENGILIIEASRIANTFSKDTTVLESVLKTINQALPSAAGIVIDARSTTKSSELDYYFDTFIRQSLIAILDTSIVLGSTRYRMHNGYASQTGAGATFYASALVNSAPQSLTGRNKTKSPPIAFIINQHSPSFTDILSGMQAAGRAVVIQEGEQSVESASGTFTMELPENVRLRMRTTELVNADGSVGLQVDAVVPKNSTDDAAMKEAVRSIQQRSVEQRSGRTAQAFASQVSQRDKPYAEMQFPGVEYRLLALFRFWNVINFFYPYKDVIGDSWQTVLARYIPKFEANKDAADYQLTVRELVTEMHDSHGGVRNANAAIEKLGTFQPPVFVGFVEDKSVVLKVLDNNLPIKVGDVVSAVDSEPVEKRRDFLSRYIAASTSQWLMNVVHSMLLFGPKDSKVKLSLRSPGGDLRDVEVPRSLSIMDPKYYGVMDRISPVVQILPSGYGYVDLARLQGAEVDKMFSTIKSTPAVIFDMRGYPHGTAWAIAPRLTEKKNPVAALFSRPLLEATSLTEMEDADGASYSFGQKLPDAKGDVYKGKVVMLINEDAISQSEHTCMFFEAATDVTFIGSPTAGANGDVTFMVLPGNLAISFTGHNVRHADGRQLQRVGIQPHIKVAPTIRGITEGRDEILDAAVEFLRKSLKK